MLKTLRLLFFVSLLGVAAPALAVEGKSAVTTLPDMSSPGPWLNSKPLTNADLKGKVVLVDFWTYSCINCLRTLPTLKGWWASYQKQGLVIIGVHAPEFDFEKNTANVEKASRRFQIGWPVVQDNDHLLWNRFSNQYWPAHYLFDRQGKLVYSHFGEGHYDVAENAIRKALGMAATKEASPEARAGEQTPETYLGLARAENFSGTPTRAERVADYTSPETLAPDHWGLTGKWQREDERITAKAAAAKLRLNFRGQKVFLVMGTETGKPVTARIFLNGKMIEAGQGADVKGGNVQVDEHRLYELVNLTDGAAGGLLEIQAATPGLEAYAFTFGN